MISQNHIDTITENLASELNLPDYDHPTLAEIVESQLNELINNITQNPSSYFYAEILSELETGKEFQDIAA